VNNRSIPSTHTERKITVCSHKHSFTQYHSLSTYRRTELWTEERIHSLRMGWRPLFSSCAVVSGFSSGGKKVLALHTYVRYLTHFLRANIFLIVVEVLRFLVHQCVVSFHSHFQYGLLPLLTPHSSDPRSKHQRYSSCK
jgi:hypothetical protein